MFDHGPAQSYCVTYLGTVATAPAWAAEDHRQAVTEGCADLEGQAAHITEATHLSALVAVSTWGKMGVARCEGQLVCQKQFSSNANISMH